MKKTDARRLIVLGTFLLLGFLIGAIPPTIKLTSYEEQIKLEGVCSYKAAEIPTTATPQINATEAQLKDTYAAGYITGWNSLTELIKANYFPAECVIDKNEPLWRVRCD